MNTIEYPNRNNSRRGFLATSGLVLASGITLLSGCGENEKEEKDISTNEDLMREHGVLKRVLLIYDEATSRMLTGKDIDIALIGEAAQLIKSFIEDYHEKLEEDHLFPRFEKAGQMVDLIKTLRVQHQKGRILTQRIIAVAQKTKLTTDEKTSMAGNMRWFIRMYSPHEAREDTILFPALHKIISKHEYDSLGENFEKIEKQQFGGDGFDMAVDKVTTIEKRLNIYDLNIFTPPV